MKKFKLYTHKVVTKTPHDIYFNSKDISNVQNGDILELKQTTSGNSFLLVQVNEIEGNNYLNRETNTISVCESLVNKSGLKKGHDVEVSIVEGHTIELVELIFKDQYYSRADMWRMRSSLLKKLIHHDQKVELLGMKASVGEMWHEAQCVTCGIVNESTRVTFRSASAQVNIFIQMSSEMWTFDNFGDLYFERAVDGFLAELFNHWHEKLCCHDASITLFSRSFYSIKNCDHLPDYMKLCLKQNHEGTYYEDFYRVVVQNERYEDWKPTLQKLKQIFNTYEKDVINFHTNARFKHKMKRDDIIDADVNGSLFGETRNSSASDGNILEVMNMALNVFEKFHIDRCFDRTGKLLIVITPGSGVFDVDRQLTNLTKQRIIDCGGCCDLICLNQQPIYLAPLFRFTKKKKVPTATLR